MHIISFSLAMRKSNDDNRYQYWKDRYQKSSYDDLGLRIAEVNG
jgi:hypothetical protein